MRGVKSCEFAHEYMLGFSISQIAAARSIARSRVRRELLLAGVQLRSKTDGIRLAAKQGRLGVTGKRSPFSDAAKANIREAAIRRGRERATGHSLKPNGYLEITRGKHKGRGQHRVIAELMLGRRLRSDEVVHHIDHNRSNNDPKNLQVMSRVEHCRLHAIENNEKRTRNQKGQFK